MLLLRATLESSLQGQLNLAESQCHKVPSFFFTDAGEARREVLALRKHKEESEKELTEATLHIAELEAEVRNLKAGLSDANGSDTGDAGSGISSKAQRELDLKEAELHHLRANERVNAASKEALNAQVMLYLPPPSQVRDLQSATSSHR